MMQHYFNALEKKKSNESIITGHRSYIPGSPQENKLVEDALNKTKLKQEYN